MPANERPSDDSEAARRSTETSAREQPRTAESSDHRAGLDQERAPASRDRSEAGQDSARGPDARTRDGFDESRAPTDAPATGDNPDRIQELASVEAQRLRAQAEGAEPAITATMQEVATQNGGELAPLDHTLKSEDSLSRKIADGATERMDAADPERAARAEADSINDALRYTVEADADTYMTTYEGTKQSLEERGFEKMSDKNTWAEPGSPDAGPYRGINTAWQSPEGQRFEVQFHTPESFAAKTEMHPLYEEYRDPNTSAERGEQLVEVMTARSDQIPVPPGALEER